MADDPRPAASAATQDPDWGRPRAAPEPPDPETCVDELIALLEWRRDRRDVAMREGGR